MALLALGFLLADLRVMLARIFLLGTHSRKDDGGVKLPRKFRSRVELVVGEPIPAEQATAALLEERVRAQRGDQP